MFVSVLVFVGAQKVEGAVQLIPLSRANNISIMLTQFSNFRHGPHDIRQAVVKGELGPERLSLLLQVTIISRPSFRCFPALVCGLGT